ncbi:MAG: hypothetical protein ACREBC_26105, partial [Pyrinomonadaceae bacterium]
ALSGSGPTVVALATGNFEEIGNRIAKCFHRRELEVTMRLLEVDQLGLQRSLAVTAETLVVSA